MFSNLPPITKALAIANGIVFLVQLAIGQQLLAPFALWPIGAGFMPWQLLTYGFMHEGWLHIFFNMLALVMFGAPLEYTWRSKRFLAYYVTCMVGAGLCQLAVGMWMGSDAPVIGASGAVFGLLLAYGMLFPNQRVMLLIPPIPMRARTLVIVYGLVELVSGFTGFQPGIAHFAHLGGMLFGWLLIRYWRGQPPFGRGGGRKPPTLRRVV